MKKVCTLLLVLAGLVFPSQGFASIQVGQIAGGGEPCLSANTAYATSTLGSGLPNPYIVPSPGVITEWQTRAGFGGGSLALQTVQPDTENDGTFAVLAESAVEEPDDGVVNTFKTRIPVKAGQALGLTVVVPGPDCTRVGQLGFLGFSVSPSPAPGGPPVAYPNAAGAESLNVAATLEPDADKDGYGDETQDGCPHKRHRHDDCVKPTVSFEKTPPNETRRTKAKFKFSSDEGKAEFSCSLDGRRPKRCDSPVRIVDLKAGRHTFSIRATDSAGNRSKKSTYGWKVESRG